MNTTSRNPNATMKWAGALNSAPRKIARLPSTTDGRDIPSYQAAPSTEGQ